MEVLVVGAGGREHAIVWKLATSDAVGAIYCAPGNGGTALIAQNVAQEIATESDCDQLAHWAYNNQIDLVIVGPEIPLRHGIADSLMMFGVPVLGPTQAAAKLEWSKVWARDFMKRHNIPSPSYEVIEGLEAIQAELRSSETTYPLVMKADGLAGGKGAEVVKDAEAAEDALARMRANGVLPEGDSSIKVVLEEYLEGFEVSALAFTDGRNVAMMPPVCDYKRLLDGDGGPLTGGMGAYTPTKRITPKLWEQIERDILTKAVNGMSDEGIPYKGVLYAGLMLTEGGPKVLEFNCRFGDPEAQVLLPRLKTPIEEIALAIAKGDLPSVGPIEWDDRASVGVVIASDNYPIGKASSQKVTGLTELDEGVLAFHSGTDLRGSNPINPLPGQTKVQSPLRNLFGRKSQETVGDLNTDYLDPKITAVGGRILTVVAASSSIAEARDLAYRNIERIKLDGVQYRRDIAEREL